MDEAAREAKRAERKAARREKLPIVSLGIWAPSPLPAFVEEHFSWRERFFQDQNLTGIRRTIRREVIDQAVAQRKLLYAQGEGLMRAAKDLRCKDADYRLFPNNPSHGHRQFDYLEYSSVDEDEFLNGWSHYLRRPEPGRIELAVDRDGDGVRGFTRWLSFRCPEDIVWPAADCGLHAARAFEVEGPRWDLHLRFRQMNRQAKHEARAEHLAAAVPKEDWNAVINQAREREERLGHFWQRAAETTKRAWSGLRSGASRPHQDSRGRSMPDRAGEGQREGGPQQSPIIKVKRRRALTGREE